MAYLATLEGADDTGYLLDRLFDTNDTLGVLIYGPTVWNKLKSFVANLSTRELVMNRGNFGAWKNQTYNSNNDVIDEAIGFNHRMGAELLGAENWGHFVNRCKMAAPVLGYDFVKNLITDPVTKSLQAILPKSASPIDFLKFGTGIQQIQTAIDTAKSITGINEREAAAKAQAEAQAFQQAQAEAEQQRQHELEIAAVQAQIEANAKTEAEKIKAQSEYNAAVNTSPERLNAQTRNLVIIGGIGLLAAVILTRRK